MAVALRPLKLTESNRIASTIEKLANDSVPKEIEVVTAHKVESETVRATSLTMKLQDSINRAPEQKTNIEMIPTFVCGPKVNPEDTNDLTLVSNDANKLAGKSVQGLGNTNERICTDVRKVHQDNDHPSGKTLFGNIGGSDIENLVKSDSITQASTEMKYSP